MKYKAVYHFMVIDKIMEGKTVYCLDKKAREVHTVNELTMNDMVAILNAENTEPDRFEYWEEVKDEKKEEGNG